MWGAGVIHPERGLDVNVRVELGLAWTLLNERPHANGTVLGGKECRELLALDLQARLEVDLEAPVDGLLGRPQGVRRRPGELRRPGHRLVVDLVGRHQLVGQPDAQRLLGTDEAAGEDDVLRAARTDQPGEPLRAAGARDDAEQDLRLAEGRVVGRDPDVGAQGQLAPAAEGVAGDRGDDRLGDPGHRGEGARQAGGALDHVRVGHVVHLLDVRTRGEDLLAAVDHDRLDVVALGRLGRAGADLLLHLGVQGVHLGAVEPDRAHTLADLEADELTPMG